ncbi:MAG TPA: FAD-dependent monooxygenase, partial [Burkholderiales bacterium]|nr:FAD-dependent monooxygenase [Burkholderiales bacterium]
RPIALSHASRLILERVGAWERLATTPIATVHVSQQGSFGRTRLEAAEAGVPALGYVVDYTALADALRTLVAARGLLGEAPGAACTVHAEGIAGDAGEKRYAQDAVVGLVDLAEPARASAFERFTPDGPLALLPCEGRYAYIWSAAPARAAALAVLEEPAFLAELSASLGPRIGRAVRVHSRAVVPLVLRVRRARVAAREVFIGNAAQTLHPVAGQGLNLGLRDAWELAQILRDAPDPGAAAALTRYAASRRADAFATIRVTDLLASGGGAPARALRALAMCALDALPGPRRFFARRMIYGPSALP